MNMMCNKLIKIFLRGGLAGIAALLLIFAGSYAYYLPQLPSVTNLKDIHLQTPLRIYSNDDRLIAEFGEKRRIPVSFDQISPALINAFTAAEDADFYNNSGIDVDSLLRAGWELISTGSIQSGGSTITMQVARNFFLSSERVFSRKFKEILLALRITKELSKQEIITLYLNDIFLGNRAYGVQAASHIYYGKPIQDLSLAQMAMLAGLPKAPSANNPLINPDRALQRRNWILSRMLKLGYVTQADYADAIQQPVTAHHHALSVELHAPYIAEMVRKDLLQQYGEKIYTEGFEVYTTIKSRDQLAAQRAVADGLKQYDRRHGYRGPTATIDAPEKWQNTLDKIDDIAYFKPAIVTRVNDLSVDILLKGDKNGTIIWKGLSWARPMITLDWRGNAPKQASDILKVGNLIWVTANSAGQYDLNQIPQAQSALVAMNPNTGEINALAGGLDFSHSHFNRALQARRQIGSLIKPFIYSAALANGMTAATMINDAPVVINDKKNEANWRPHNADSQFNGPTRLRQALYQSRNLVSIRILQRTGISNTLNYIENMGLPRKQLPDYLSLALGAADMTPLQLATGYAVLANGGFKVHPHYIKKITSSKGLIFESSALHVCKKEPIPIQSVSIKDDDLTSPAVQTDEIIPPKQLCAESVMSPQVNYIINNIMKDVITKGTGKKALALHRQDLAGKTGTTNDHKDTWFVGYNPDMLAIVWMGKDNATTLGRWEYGATTTLPVWVDFMRYALKGKPNIIQPQPPGMVTVRIDKNTGQLSQPGSLSSYFEIFRKEHAPLANTLHSADNPSLLGFQAGDIY